jgi:hypothetical protein
MIVFNSRHEHYLITGMCRVSRTHGKTLNTHGKVFAMCLRTAKCTRRRIFAMRFDTPARKRFFHVLCWATQYSKALNDVLPSTEPLTVGPAHNLPWGEPSSCALPVHFVVCICFAVSRPFAVCLSMPCAAAAPCVLLCRVPQLRRASLFVVCYVQETHGKDSSQVYKSETRGLFAVCWHTS